MNAKLIQNYRNFRFVYNNRNINYVDIFGTFNG